MTTVLAALDASAAARPVLDAAIGLGELLGADVAAVHVSEGRHDALQWLASHEGVPLRLLEGDDVEGLLLDTLVEPDAVAAVFGARRTTGGRRPVGHVAMHIVERSRKPIVIVPPEADPTAHRPLRRVLVPLEGNEASSRPVLEVIRSIVVAPVELVVLHVFTPRTTPKFLDRPQRDLALWSDEFIARFCPNATSIELRSGSIGARVGEVCTEQRAGMIILSWSQNMSRGHAAVIRDVLAGSSVPVMLLPVLDAGGLTPDEASAPS